jgi:hypothetical protein
MATQYKVISDCLCLTSRHKARKIESHLNTHSADGWEFVALDPVIVFGCDVGFYLVLKRIAPESMPTQP